MLIAKTLAQDSRTAQLLAYEPEKPGDAERVRHAIQRQSRTVIFQERLRELDVYRPPTAMLGYGTTSCGLLRRPGAGPRQRSFRSDKFRQEIEGLFKEIRSGVSAHVSAPWVAFATQDSGTVYSYPWRVEAGSTRAIPWGQGSSPQDISSCSAAPQRQDIPHQYRYLLGG